MNNAAGISPTRSDAAGDGQRVLHFAGRTLDLDRHILLAADGVPVALTRGELALLRALARRPGHVLTRDQLLDEISGRRAFVFDRSVDMMVARLRRKIGDHGRGPRLIETVPGVGYRLAAQVASGAATVAAKAPAAGLPGVGHRWRIVAAIAAVGVLAVLTVGGSRTGSGPAMLEPVTTVILPFANLGGDSEQSYFAEGVATHLAIQLGTFPVMRVVAAPAAEEIGGRSPVEVARAVGADYAVQGEVLKGKDRVRITAQLYDSRSGLAAWGDRFDADGDDPIAMQEGIAERIYRSISGFRGIVHQEAIRDAWRKATPTLDEYDYVLRGHHYYMRFTTQDVLTARSIWQAGLERFPDSALLRGKLAWTHVWMVMNQQTDDMAADTEAAWALALAAERIEPKSPMTVYLLHYLMAFLYQLHDDDFGRSVDEARAALAIAPYDSLLHTDLAFFLANAGQLEEAVASARWAVDHEAHPPAFYWNNLGWADYVAGRYDDAIAATRAAGESGFGPQLAASLMALGRAPEARAVMAEWRTRNPHDSIAAEARWPLIEPYKAAWLGALRNAGLPEE